MNGVLGRNSAQKGYTGPGTTLVNEMKFRMNHTPGAGLIAQPVDLQSRELPLSYRHPPKPFRYP